MVTIELNLTLANTIGAKVVHLEIDEPKSLSDVLKMINLSIEDVGMVIKNNVWSPLQCIIEENDHIQLFPVLQGG